MTAQTYYDELVNGVTEPVDYATSDIKQLADVLRVTKLRGRIMFDEDNPSINKFKNGWRTYRKYEDKASVPVFLLSVLVFIVAGLFYLTPAASDKIYFIGFVVLVLVVLASWLGALVKKRNQYINKDK